MVKLYELITSILYVSLSISKHEASIKDPFFEKGLVD